MAPGLPTDCWDIYPQAIRDEFADEELNHQLMVDGTVSRHPAIEEIRNSLPGIECHWGLPTEGGIANAVNVVDGDVQARSIVLMATNDHVCEEFLGGAVCRQLLIEPPLPGVYDESWTISEEHFFKDGLWVSTWWAGIEATSDRYTDGIYRTIWT